MKFLATVGTYERVVFGVDFEVCKDKSTGKITVVSAKDAFAVPAHLNSVRSVASCPRFLVSGSADDTIKIFDLKKRKDMGIIGEHNGCIASLEFFGSSHLLSGSEDGKVALFRTSDWECLHVFHHKTPVSAVGIHPSGKLAISIACQNRSLRLWNLVTGKAAGKAKLPFAAEKIIWSPSGSKYAIFGPSELAVYDASNTAEPVKTFKACSGTCSKFLTARFIDDQQIILAGEGSNLVVLPCSSKGDMKVLKTCQKPRIKDISIISSAEFNLILTVASDSTIALWSLESITDAEINALLVHPIRGLRPICMTASLQ